MSPETKNIKDAAAVILLKDGKVYLAQRNPKMSFLGGWHAFPGGKLDAEDARIEVRNAENEDSAKYIVCAARETFEETGVLLVRNGDTMTKGQRASLFDDLMSKRSTFAEILAHWGLWIDAEDFTYAGFWTTPQFSPVRFKTRFFLVNCPPKQSPAQTAELVAGNFCAAPDALKLWDDSEILISPPVFLALRELAKVSVADKVNENQSLSPEALKICAENLREKSRTADGAIDFIEFNSHILCLPLKTDTLPPATHTNCFIVGKKKFVVIDAAARSEREQAKLHRLIGNYIEKGGVCDQIVVTHAHPDHFGGENALQKYLRDNFNLEVPVSAHKLTAENLRGKVEFQKTIDDGENFILEDENHQTFALTAVYTPGHARGQLAFYDAEKGFLLSGDNVIAASSVVIAPPEGNMRDYLESLEKLKNLPHLRFLCGSHGAAIYNAAGKIADFIEHRRAREAEIVRAVKNGANDVKQIVSVVYAGLAPTLVPLAELSVAAHLEKIAEDKIERQKTALGSE